MVTNNPTQLDPNALLLTKAIGLQESGNEQTLKPNYQAKGASGEYGAYQYLPATWEARSKQYLGTSVLLNQATPEQQNKVQYMWVKDKLDKGFTPAEVASMHNAGEGNKDAYLGNSGTNSMGVKYDTSAYVKGVQKYGQILEQQTNNKPIAPVQDQTPSVGGFLQNTVNSAGNVLGALGNAVLHPIDTVTNLLSTGAGAVESATNKLGLTHIDNQDTQNFGNLVSVYGQKYGGSNIGEVVHNIGHSLYTDPLGVALDLSVVLDGAGAALGTAGKVADTARATEISKLIGSTSDILKSGDPMAIKQLSNPGTLTKIADAVKTVADYTNPITPVIKGVTAGTKLAGNAVMGLGSKIIGEDPSVLADLVKNPQDYSKASMEATSRGGLANEFGNAIEQVKYAKSEAGSEYNGIRSSGAVVNIPTETIVKTFADNGLKVTKDINGGWKIAAPTADTTLSSADVSHFKSFLDQFGGQQLNANQLLNARSKLSEFSNYEGKTNASTQLARSLRGTYDELGKTQIPNLKIVDEKNAPIIQKVKGITKEFLAKDTSTGEWTLKPNTASKLANALKAGKEPLLAKLEEVLPGITRKIEILKNIESIENSLGIKTATYTKSGLEIGGIMTGNVPLAVGMIIAHPSIANQILRGFGFVSAKTVIPVLGRVRALLGLLPKGAGMATVKLGTDLNKAKSAITSSNIDKGTE